MSYQVRRTPEWQSSVTGDKWQVVGRTNGWPVHITARTKVEAQQIKADLQNGPDPMDRWLEKREFEAWEREFAL